MNAVRKNLRVLDSFPRNRSRYDEKRQTSAGSSDADYDGKNRAN